MIVETVIQKKRRQRDREVELGQGQEVNIEVGQGTGESIEVQVGKGDKEVGQGIRGEVEVGRGIRGEVQVGQGIRGEVEVGQGIERVVEVGQETGGAVEVGQETGGGKVEVGQEGGKVVGVVTNMMIGRKKFVIQLTLKVVNRNRRNVRGPSPSRTVRMDKRTGTKSPERIGQEVPRTSPNPAVTKSRVAVRSLDTGLDPAQGGETFPFDPFLDIGPCRQISFTCLHFVHLLYTVF